MGFNQCYLPSVEIMQNSINEYGLDSFVKSYRKYDSISGETDRVEFFENKIKEYEKINININHNSITD
jgi:hypothetical protein